eukprot:TRINITY_DN32513_c0_g1_i1.p1 TRINITY_DN32513_c0_g1~~TRINITY_DN32513_c0_g1_i1.p1  ORF type:complete len:780 (+),score=118.56 TRINITY_DN32513_c0_g1_i1:73-2412(+)
MDMSSPSSKRGDFEFVKELGRGSYAIVHKVRRKRDQKVCVIKVVQMRHMTPKQRTQALSEAQIMKKLQSPHIVQYLDAFIEKESLHLVLQHCDRGDLKGFLSKVKVVPVRTSWRIFLHAALGLAYLHNRRILHRDVKSENIFLVGTDDGVKIGDLGLAKMLSNSQSGAQTLVGTPRYLSPEEVIGSAHYSDKCDAWSLGVVLYEVCSEGHRGIFDEATQLHTLLHKILHEEPPPLPTRTDTALRELCSALLIKDVHERPSVAEMLRGTAATEHAEKYEVWEVQSLAAPGGRPNRLTTPPTPGTSHASAPSAGARGSLSSEIQLLESDELSDGFCSKILACMCPEHVESALGARFHRLPFCEICEAQGVNSAFSLFTRRHHCRSCGRSVCAQHSPETRPMPHLEYSKPQRVCELCLLAGVVAPSSEHGSQVVTTLLGGRLQSWDSRTPANAMWTTGESMSWACPVQGGERLLTIEGGVLRMRGLNGNQDTSRKLFMPKRSSGGTSSPRRPPSNSAPESVVDSVVCAGELIAMMKQDQRNASTVLVAEYATGKNVGHCSVTTEQFTCLCLGSSAPAFVATGSSSGAVRVWSILGNDSLCELRCVLQGHRDAVSCLILGGGGHILCSGSSDGTVRLWRTKKGELNYKANTPAVCTDFRSGGAAGSLACDGSSLAFVQAPRLGSWEQGAALWDVVLGQWQRSFFKSSHSVRCVALRGALLATSGGAASTRGCMVQLWHASTGVALSVIRCPALVTQISLLDCPSTAACTTEQKPTRVESSRGR